MTIAIKDWFPCWLTGHVWKFNGGDPLCLKCGIWKFGKPTRRVLGVVENR